MGVLAGADMTPEAALTKLSYILASNSATPREDMRRNLRGELTVPIIFSHHVTTARDSLLGYLAMLKPDKSKHEIEKLIVPVILKDSIVNGDLEGSKRVLDLYGGYVNIKDGNDISPLKHARNNGTKEIIDELFNRGAIE